MVEFCGLPGAGKSYLARRLVGSLRVSGIICGETTARYGPDAPLAARVRRKALAVVREMPHGVSPTRLVWSVAMRSEQASLRDRIARPTNLVVAQRQTRVGMRRDGVHVLDQGVSQEWWSAALRGDRDAVLRAMRVNMSAGHPTCSLLVRVDAPIPLLVDRLVSRSNRQSRLEAQSPERIAAELLEGSKLLDEIVAVTCDATSVQAPKSIPELVRIESLDPTWERRLFELVVQRSTGG